MAEQIGSVSQLKNGLFGAGLKVPTIRAVAGQSIKLASFSKLTGFSFSAIVSCSMGGTSSPSIFILRFSVTGAGATTAYYKWLTKGPWGSNHLVYLRTSDSTDVYLVNSQSGSLLAGGLILLNYELNVGLASIVNTDSIGDDAIDFTEET